MTNYIFYGLVISVINFAYTLILYLMGFHGEKFEQGTWLGYFGILITIFGLYFAVRESRKEVLEIPRDFTYGSGFKASFLTVIFIAIGAAIFTYIYGAYINPEMVDHVIEIQKQKMIEQGRPDEMIQGMENATRGMMKPPFQALFGFFGTIFTGLIISLILPIFTRQKAEKSVAAEA